MKSINSIVLPGHVKTVLVCSLFIGTLAACDSDGNNDSDDLVNDVSSADLTDLDNDLFPNDIDNCSLVANPDQSDIDGDGIGDVCDSQNDLSVADMDADSIEDGSDNCPTMVNTNQLDTDNDGIGDVCDATDDSIVVVVDIDADGVEDSLDNCPTTANTDQLDTDNDGIGDVCDATDDSIIVVVDTDADGVEDSLDNCPTTANTDQLDTDNDGFGDVCDATDDSIVLIDTDSDGIEDSIDNCSQIINADQSDVDGDGLGDVCDVVDDRLDIDSDGDGLSDESELELGLDPQNADTDADGVPDGTDQFPNDPQASLDSDNDGVSDERDQFPNDPSETSDLNGDGLGDNANPFDGTVISGVVIEQETAVPLAGALVSLELVNTSSDTNPVVLTETDVEGGFVLVAAQDLIPDSFVIVVTADGFQPIAIPLTNADEIITAGQVALTVTSDNFVGIEVLPSVHHLGDDNFTGSQNSQFQRNTEGAQLVRSFNLSIEQASSEALFFNWVAKGIQIPNTISINGALVASTGNTNIDGSYTLQSFLLTTTGILLEGANTLTIESQPTNIGTDIDDFEFVILGVNLP